MNYSHSEQIIKSLKLNWISRFPGTTAGSSAQPDPSSQSLTADLSKPNLWPGLTSISSKPILQPLGAHGNLVPAPSLSIEEIESPSKLGNFAYLINQKTDFSQPQTFYISPCDFARKFFLKFETSRITSSVCKDICLVNLFNNQRV